MYKRLWLRLSISASVVLLLAACGAAAGGSSGNTQETPSVATPTENNSQEAPGATTPAAPGAAELEGIEWRLVEYGPADAPVAAVPDVAVTVKFDAANKIGGSGGCNSYGGEYQLDGQSLKVSQVASTMMACENAAAMNQESTFLAALGSATGVQVAGDTLTLTYDGGQLHFTRS